MSSIVPIGFDGIAGEHCQLTVQRERQAQQRSKIIAEYHHELGLAAFAESLPERTTVVRLIDLVEACAHR